MDSTQTPQFHEHSATPSCLQLSLKTKWFEMTKAGIKTEYYREITPYWANRLLGQSKAFWKGYLGYNENNKRCYGFKDQSSIDFIIAKCKGFKPFQFNIITLGCPSASDLERIIHIKHKGIEIRTGNHEWGAEPNKLYFVIMHEPSLHEA
ncbi:MAG: hypothetical protein OEL54_01650 [Flavobacteriaceae bacterium]|nr:hypothetical protein [Flavobacteriaceae bacterium]